MRSLALPVDYCQAAIIVRHSQATAFDVDGCSRTDDVVTVQLTRGLAAFRQRAAVYRLYLDNGLRDLTVKRCDETMEPFRCQPHDYTPVTHCARAPLACQCLYALASAAYSLVAIT